MTTSSTALMSDRSSRLESVREFNIRTLKLLNYYSGYTTTSTLSLVHGYTKAGVRKRMNSMVKGGWVRKIAHDEGLGRSEQIWCITKSGRIAAQTENDKPLESHKLKGFSISDYSPALAPHTGLVQVMASRLDQLLNTKETKPFKLEIKEYGRNRYVYPDIVFERSDREFGGKQVGCYSFCEVELTVKTIKRYRDLFFRLALHNRKVNYQDEGFVVSDVVYITTPLLHERLKNVLSRLNANVSVFLFNYEQIMDQENLDFEEAEIELPSIEYNQLEDRA